MYGTFSKSFWHEVVLLAEKPLFVIYKYTHENCYYSNYTKGVTIRIDKIIDTGVKYVKVIWKNVVWHDFP